MTNGFSIRRVTKSDAAAIAHLSGELGYSTDAETIRARLATVLASDADLIIAAVDSEDKAIIGWLQAHAAHIIESGFRVEITGLAVASTSRRHGVGRALVEQAEQWAGSLHASAIVVRSNVSRVESHLFYPSLGYAITKTQKVYRKNFMS